MLLGTILIKEVLDGIKVGWPDKLGSSNCCELGAELGLELGIALTDDGCTDGCEDTLGVYETGVLG